VILKGRRSLRGEPPLLSVFPDTMYM